MSVGFNSNYNSTYRATSSTTKTSSSDAATKNLLKKYNMELDYATALLSKATTPEAKERCQLKVNAANEKIMSLTQPTTTATQPATPEVATPQATNTPQVPSGSLGEKTSNFDWSYPLAITPKAVTTATPEVVGGVSTTNSNTANTTTTANSGEPVNVFANRTGESRAAEAKEIKPFVGQVDYYQTVKDRALTQKSKDIAQTKIDDANLSIYAIQLKYANTPEAKASVQEKIDNLTANRKIVRSEANVSAGAANETTGTTSTTGATAPTVTTSTPVTTEDTEKTETTPIKTPEELAAIATEVASINKRLEELPGEFSAFFQKASALVVPTLNDPANASTSAITKYSKQFDAYQKQYQDLVDKNKAIQAEELELRGKLAKLDPKAIATKASTFNDEDVAKEVTKIQTRLAEIAKVYPTLLPKAMSLVAPTLTNKSNPTTSEKEKFIADSTTYNETIKALSDASDSLKAEKLELQARFTQLSLYKSLTKDLDS